MTVFERKMRDDKKLVEIVLAAAGRMHGRLALSCAAAHRIAAAAGVPLRRIGEVCERKNIKITDCQLGCFGRLRPGRKPRQEGSEEGKHP
jgi:hypothetical protein